MARMSIFGSLNSWCKTKYHHMVQGYQQLLELNNIEKSRVVSGLLIFFHGFFLLSLLLNAQHPFLNRHAVLCGIFLLCSYILLASILYLFSFYIKPNPKTNRYFPILCLGTYSATLMSIGAFTGMMTIVTGVFTIGSILTGLLIFERHAIFWGSIPCLVVFYGISLLNLLDILPYAALFPPYSMVPQHAQNMMIIMNLVTTTLVGIVIIRVFHAFLNRWKAREQRQRILMSLDPLTQVLNRRGLSHHYESIQSIAEQEQFHLCITLLDLDYFKMVNDRYGHDAGDLVLKTLAQILKKNLREYDHIGRFGGEEFMIIFTHTSAEKILPIVERCRQAIENYELQYQNQVIHFTASFGLSCSSHYGYDYAVLIKKADQALYQAKNSGRNCICIAQT